MNAAKFTPGPWSSQASPAHGYRIRTSDSTSNLRFGSGDIGVVFFAGNGRSTEQCKSDARLIAAAPELLEALRESVALADRNLANFGGDPIRDRTPECRASYEKCVAAIAKATGEKA